MQITLNELSSKQIIAFDEEKKAAMVSNLMVVLCSDKDAGPVLNARHFASLERGMVNKVAYGK